MDVHLNEKELILNMKSSLGKTLWKICSVVFDVFIKLFYVFYFLLFIYILLQVKPEIDEAGVLFISYFLPVIIGRFIPLIPIWIQLIYLWVYFNFSQQLFVGLLSSGIIDYNFAWSLPIEINNLIGVSISGKFIDLIFWSGFIIGIIFVIDSFGSWLLTLLARKMKIDWAKELLQQRFEEISKFQKQIQAVSEAEKTEGDKGNQVSLKSTTNEINERIVFKPKFFKDRLWYVPCWFLTLVSPVLILPFLAGGDLRVFDLSNPIIAVFGGTALIVFLIFLPFFLWEGTTRIILEKDKIIIKTFYFKKTEIPFQSIKNIYTQKREGLKIVYEKQINDKKFDKIFRFFPWAFTIEKLLLKLKPRLNKISINDDFIIDSIKTLKAARNPTTVLTIVITMGLLIGFLYYIFYQIENRPKLSDKDCADYFIFWVNDKPNIGILETKGESKPELSIDSPFYLFINAKESFPECNKNISFTINNDKGNIVFRSGNLIPPKTGIGNYHWDAIIKEKGNYVFKSNYENIPSKTINFLVT